MFLFKNKTPKNINFNGKTVKEIIFNGVSVWVGKILALVTGIPPLELTSSTGEDLVDYKVYGETVQNGTPAPDAPVEMECVGDYDEETGKYKIPIRVSSKNLVDYTALTIKDDYTISGETYEDGIYIGKGNAGSGATGWSAGQLSLIFEKECIANKTYTVSIPITMLEQGVYDNRAVLLLGKGTSYSRHAKTIYLPLQKETVYTFTITPTININQLSIRFNNNKLKVNIGRMMVEENSVATEFAPYFEPVTTDIYLNEPLRKVAGYADYIDFKNQKIVRNINEITLDDSASVSKWVDSTYTFYISLPFSMFNDASKVLIKSDRLVAVSGNKITADINKEGQNIIATHSAGCILKANNYKEIAEFKAWLNENPLIIQNVRKTPKEEDIELPSVLLNEGSNIVSIDTVIQPNNVEIEYYKISE